MSKITGVIADYWQNPRKKLYVFLLLLVNLFGSIWGYLWYRGQLLKEPLIFWPLIPDSPLSTTLLTLAFFLMLFGREITGLTLWAGMMCFKYGFWALGILMQFWYLSGRIEPVEVMLFVSHLGMIVESIIYVKGIPVTKKAYFFSVIWLILEDVVDWGFGLHPYLFLEEQFSFAVVLALVLSGFILVYFKKLAHIN
ncbi:hypothetical protein ciss_06800 [Carboxydothermus islandicus]|uniref:DUF1405 domain-containing protein n=1 Tax=Carboxydothermus islandicus TaxID=661089 RepID=A0A1L8D0U4_9THEO|nr:DUF1405 domain-containing protein [Carboxydothermus islandicus]GAV24747.1 hypothetical protein ciss_06800 [Carboxydothermus islandicus]